IAAIGVIRLLPWFAPNTAPIVVDRPAVTRTIVGLLVCAVAFPVVVGIADISGSEWYFLAKIGLLIVVPGIIVLVYPRSISVMQPTRAWQWWPPLLVVAVWTVLSKVTPWVPATDFGQVDPIFLIVVATLTALTAGVGEEIFYRWWLQTRLEALLGQWGGIVVASLFFALMHLGGERQGSGVLVEIAAVIVVQGSFGLMLGYMWSKYRNLWVVILAHIIANGYGVVEFLLRG
ncbi:MAG TPA: CPBP family intramembrane glutamic endopeptidase, partial [Glaciihabitans sp.]|nr:CPBP family intramembrane glutamic endopeptidase [Glaciihabitans sp.]